MHLPDYIRAIPKVELHIHLEGSIRPETALMLARRNHVTLPAETADELRAQYHFTDFAHFIRLYVQISATLRTAEDFAQIVRDFGADLARQNIRYAEANFTVMTHIQRGVPWEAIRDGLDAGRADVRAQHGVELAWIFDIVRSFPETATGCCDYAIAGLDHGVIGLGLGGPEHKWPPTPYADIFARARAAGLHALPHAGEHDGPASIWGALRDLGAERIGHGVQCIHDPALMAYLHEHQIPLEINPTSNICLGLFPTLADHPFGKLWDAGLYVTVNSDDPPLFNTDLVTEYQRIAATFNLSADDVETLSLRALRASCLPAARRAALETEFRAEFARLRAL